LKAFKEGFLMSASQSIFAGFAFMFFVFHVYVIVIIKNRANVISIKKAFLYLIIFPISIFINYRHVLFKSNLLAFLGIIVFFGYLDAVGHFILFGSSSQSYSINQNTASLGVYFLVFMIPIWDVIRSIFGIRNNDQMVV
jgi:hypothetical protein